MTRRDRTVAFIADGMMKRPWVLALGVFLFGAFFWVQAPRVVLRSDVDDFVLKNDPARLFRLELEKYFAKNNLFVVALSTHDVFTNETLSFLKTLTGEIKSVDGVESALSLANVNDMVGTADSFTVEPLFETPPTGERALNALRRRALDNKMYRRNLISLDSRTAAVVVYLPPSGDGRNPAILRQVKSILELHRKAGWIFHLAGNDVTGGTMADMTNADVVRFMPLVLVLALATVYWVFKNGWVLFLAAVGVLSTILATVGLSAAAGIPMSSTTVAVLPLVVTLSLSDLIHLFSHLDRKTLDAAGSPRAGLKGILKEILFPCLLTSVNTAIGFGSLAWNDIPAVQGFGFLAAAGMFFEFLFTFGLVAPLVLLLPARGLWRDPKTHESRAIPTAVRKAHETVRRRPAIVFALCVGALAWAGWQMRRLQVENSALTFFRAKEPLRLDLEFIRDRLAGVTPIDLSFRTETPETFRDPEALSRLDRIQKAIDALPGVDASLSVVDYFKQMNQAFHADDPRYYAVPASRRLVDQYLLLYDADDLEEYVNNAYTWTRLRVRVHGDESKFIGQLLRGMTAIVSGPDTEGWRVDFLGEGVESSRTADSMIRSQIKNIAGAVLTIGLVMALVLRSAPMALLFLVPNLFPITLNFGIMATLGITVNTGTVLIASSAFGIVVDDTVHFFTRLKEFLDRGRPLAQALHDVTGEKGEAALSSAAILSAGFGVLMLGHFVPVVQYGFLNVVIMATGMIGDMFFLKSIFYLRPQWLFYSLRKE